MTNNANKKGQNKWPARDRYNEWVKKQNKIRRLKRALKKTPNDKQLKEALDKLI